MTLVSGSNDEIPPWSGCNEMSYKKYTVKCYTDGYCGIIMILHDQEWDDPWRKKWQLTPAFLPGKSHRGSWRATVHGVAKRCHSETKQQQQQLCLYTKGLEKHTANSSAHRNQEWKQGLGHPLSPYCRYFFI